MPTLSPSQQTVCDSLQAVWSYHNLFQLWSYSGLGRTTMVAELHHRLGGIRLGIQDFVSAQIGRDPTAIEDTIYCVVRDALQAADHVFVDDWHLLADSMSPCGHYPRAGYLEAVGAAIAALATASRKRLLIASESGLPQSMNSQCFPQGIGEFDVDDYRHLCHAYGGDATGTLDFEQLYRFAPRLNAYQLREVCDHFVRTDVWSTDSFIDYLRERQLVSNVRLAEVAPVRFEDLIGVDDVIEGLLKHIVMPLENDTLAQQFDLKPKRGVLLLGPPGTGKTTIGKALAHRLRGKFFLIDGTVISGTDRFYHQIHSIFQLARDNAPSVIFIDDSDVIFENQQEHGLYRYLLTMLDGLEGQSNGRVCVMLTAMELQHIPPALMRSGRVELWLETRYPSTAARVELLQRLTASLPAEIAGFDLDSAALATDGCSGADLKRLVNDAKTLCAWDKFQGHEIQPFSAYLLQAVSSFHEKRAEYHAAENRGRKQRANRPAWFDVATGKDN
ncbi:AAA family ATPase [bacterium]|nr:AAA family ATPase [bacterium]